MSSVRNVGELRSRKELTKMNTLRSIRGAAAGAVGASAVAGAMLFGGIPAAQAAPAPAPATSFETVGPHGGAPLGPVGVMGAAATVAGVTEASAAAVALATAGVTAVALAAAGVTVAGATVGV